MPLNESKGNMYEFVTHTWNAIKGACPHDCSYCYMKRWGKLNPARLDEKEFKTDLGSDNFIFVGSSCDMFAKDIPEEWIGRVLKHCEKNENKYLFQTKNPMRFLDYIGTSVITDKSVLCTTVETNRWYPDIMLNSPHPMSRAEAMDEITDVIDCYLTIEPIMDFDFHELIAMALAINPLQINIGADTGKNNLPEPSKEKILELISGLEEFTIVHQKSNLKRLLK